VKASLPSSVVLKGWRVSRFLPAGSPGSANPIWVVIVPEARIPHEAKPPFGRPEAVLAYLGRFTHREAISNAHLVSANANAVAFRWKDYRIKPGDRQKVMRLTTPEFIRRFLIHILPPFGSMLCMRLLGNGRVPPHPALRPAGQLGPQGQHHENPRLAPRPAA